MVVAWQSAVGQVLLVQVGPFLSVPHRAVVQAVQSPWQVVGQRPVIRVSCVYPPEIPLPAVLVLFLLDPGRPRGDTAGQCLSLLGLEAAGLLAR